MKNFIKASAIAAALGATSFANAGIITSWGYTNEAGFSMSSDSNGNPVTQTGFQSAGSTILSVDTYTGLEWGSPVDGVNRSSLEITTPVSGAITTAPINGALMFENGTDITHNNFGIQGDADEWLDGATVIDGLQLGAASADVPLTPGQLALISAAAPELTFNFDFLETPNNPGGGTCVDGAPVGGTGFGCLDYFVFQPIPGLPLTVSDNGTPDPTDDFIEFGVTFDLVDGGFPQMLADALDLVTEYEVITRLSGLTILSTTSPEICGTLPACVGFSTVERDTNVLTAQFAVRAVPAPATIALLGLALFAIGAGVRRKNA